MTILGHNLGQNSHQAQLSMGDLGERVRETKREVDGVLGKMKNDLLIRKERIEEIALMCENSEDSTIIYFAELLRETGDINIKDNHNYTLLLSTWSIELIELLLAHPDILVNEKWNGRYSVLVYMVSVGHIEAVKLLLAHPDILINEKDPGGSTALIEAARQGKIDILKLLLEDPRMNIHEHNQLVEAYKNSEDEDTRNFLEQKLGFYGLKIPFIL